MQNVGVPTGIGLLDHVDGLVGRLCGLCVEAVRDCQVDSIHHARVTTRRLKAAIDLLAPIASGELRKPFSKTLRKLRRRLSGLRDLDVMQQRLAEAAPDADAGAKWLRERLSAQRVLLASKAQKLRLPGLLDQLGAWWGLKHEFIQSSDRIPELLHTAILNQVDDFSATADFVASLDAAENGAEHEGADPHELRIAGKLLRYTLELADAQGMSPPENALKLFKQMQDHLGEWHDWVVLCDRAMTESLDAGLSHRDPLTQSGVLKVADVAARKSADAMGAFRALWREQGSTLTSELRDAYAKPPEPAPSAAPKTKRSRKDRGQRGFGESAAPENPPQVAPQAG